MKKTKIFLYSALALSAVSLQSCLDYDTPGDEFNANQEIVPPVTSSGKADSIQYQKEISDDGVRNAIARLDNTLGTALTGIYGLRGGKEGGAPEEHAYQFLYTLGPDNYVQYFCVPHSDFPYSNFTLRSTYDMCKGAIGGPGGGFGAAKQSIAPALNAALIDSVPELKAIYLTFFDYSAIENADLFGPMPYAEHKDLREESPFTYNSVREIYYGVKKNLDDVVACLDYYKGKQVKEVVKTDAEGNPILNREGTPETETKEVPNRSDVYKEEVTNVMYTYLPVVNKLWERDWQDLDVWKRFANSLKLRMAIHMSKVEPQIAKKWAEEAIRSGVIESTDDEVAVYPSLAGCTHPLAQIVNWGDVVMGASFLNMLQNLQHPYMKYLFTKNSVGLAKVKWADPNSSCPETTESNSVYVGMRDGAEPGEGQAAANNPYCGYSTLKKEYLGETMVPLYLMKYSEVCFLRAEGALRGWDMGGSAQHFYEEGIRYAGLESRDMSDKYDQLVDEYMNVTAPTGEKYVDPQGISPDMESVTKIGVKWNEGDSQETKLEKIITQKYIASFPYSYEAWVDLRRTGYPKLFPVLGVDDGDGTIQEGDENVQTYYNIMRRIPWASDDPQTKADIAETGLPALGEDAGGSATDTQMQRLWWDVPGDNF